MVQSEKRRPGWYPGGELAKPPLSHAQSSKQRTAFLFRGARAFRAVNIGSAAWIKGLLDRRRRPENKSNAALRAPSAAGTRPSGFPRRRFGGIMPPCPAIRTSAINSPGGEPRPEQGERLLCAVPERPVRNRGRELGRYPVLQYRICNGAIARAKG
jgi:hypothetical protein